MHATHQHSRRRLRLLAGAALVLAGARVDAITPGEADAFPDFDSYIKVTGQAASVTGDGAAFQKGTQQPETSAWGLEDLHYSKDLSKSVTLVLDGRALSGLEDYLAHVNLSKVDVGSVDAGYKSFRTFYDGIGGFFPYNQIFQALKPEDLHVDRGSFWVNAKLELPDRPVFTLSYRDETRTGQKDSTMWGDSNLTGLPTTPSSNADRKIDPDTYTLDEHHQIAEGTMKLTLGRTTATVILTGDWVNNNDVRNYDNYLGETKPNAQAIILDQQMIKSHSFSAVVKTETELNGKFSLETGWRYQHLDSDLAGSQRYTNVGLAPTANVTNLTGGSAFDIYAGNIFLKYTPDKFWLVDVGIRGENNSTSSSDGWIAVGGTNAVPTYTTDAGWSHVSANAYTPALSFNYNGWERADLYGSFEDRISRGDQHWLNPYNVAVGPAASGTFLQEANQDSRDAALGANWNAATGLSFRAEVFYKDHQNKFVGYGANLGNLYVLGYQFTGAKLSLIYTPVAQLSFNTRYQPQTGEMQVTYSGAGSDFTSGKAHGQMFSETINWTPVKQFYVQANANVSYNTIQTSYPIVGGTGDDRLHNSDNNFVSGSALCGFTVSKDADLQLEATDLRANNYVPEFAAVSTTSGGLPYGAGYREDTVTLTYKEKFSNQWIATIKFGYFTSTSDMTGGNTDYHGPLAYVGLEHAL